MVKESTLKIVSNFINKLRNIHGELFYAVAIPNTIGDENTSLTLFLASEWIENKGQREVLTLIIQELRNQLGEKSGEIVSRITLVSLNDPIITLFSPIGANSSGISISRCRFGDVEVEEAYIF